MLVNIYWPAPEPTFIEELTFLGYVVGMLLFTLFVAYLIFSKKKKAVKEKDNSAPFYDLPDILMQDKNYGNNSDITDLKIPANYTVSLKAKIVVGLLVISLIFIPFIKILNPTTIDNYIIYLFR